MSDVKSKRIWEIDMLRALAVLGMLYFHWFYLLDFWDLKNTNLFVDGWEVFGNTIRNTFFMVVGAGLVLSYQHGLKKDQSYFDFGVKTIKKGLILLALGGIITVWSTFFAPDQIIRFGVLSFIGAGMMLVWPFVPRWYALAALTGVLLLVQTLFGETWSNESLWAYILGFYPRYWPSLDYFPFEPWLASISGGALIASLIFKEGARRYPDTTLPAIFTPLIWVGQQALWIYLLHIPVFALIIKGLEIVGVY
jgi:uncharacterized membrane protein